MAIKTKNQLVAWDLATQLNDQKHLPIYMRLAKRYPEDLLRQTLSEVKLVFHREQIKRKGAYFIVSFFNKLKK